MTSPFTRLTDDLDLLSPEFNFRNYHVT